MSENKRVLMIYHMNLLKKNAGNSIYAYNITKSLKNFGCNIDFLSAAYFDDFSNINELNHNENNLLNNIYLYEGAQKKKQYNYSSFTWVNDGFLNYFHNILKNNKYDFIFIHYVNFLDFIKFSNIGSKIKIIAIISDFEALQIFYNTKSIDNFGRNIEQEIKLLDYVDETLCISSDEYNFFARFYPNKKFRLLPMALPTKHFCNRQKDIDCLFLGHANKYNLDAMLWFIDNVQPYLNKQIKITICGKVNEMIRNNAPEYYNKMLEYNYNFINFAEDLDELYTRTKIAIVPIQAGTGLKIKTITAMSYGIPVVTTPLGVDGFLDKSRNGCLVTDNGFNFANYITTLLADSEFYTSTSKNISMYYDNHFSYEIFENTLNKTLNDEASKLLSLRKNGNQKQKHKILKFWND